MTNFENTMPDTSIAIHKMAESSRTLNSFNMSQRVTAGECLIREMPAETLGDIIAQQADLIVEALQGRGHYADKSNELLAEQVFDFYNDDIESHFFHVPVTPEPEEIEIGAVEFMRDIITPAMELHAVMYPSSCKGLEVEKCQ